VLPPPLPARMARDDTSRLVRRPGAVDPWPLAVGRRPATPS